jgi:hypothetical protein
MSSEPRSLGQITALPEQSREAAQRVDVAGVGRPPVQMLGLDDVIALEQVREAVQRVDVAGVGRPPVQLLGLAQIIPDPARQAGSRGCSTPRCGRRDDPPVQLFGLDQFIPVVKQIAEVVQRVEVAGVGRPPVQLLRIDAVVGNDDVLVAQLKISRTLQAGIEFSSIHAPSAGGQGSDGVGCSRGRNSKRRLISWAVLSRLPGTDDAALEPVDQVIRWRWPMPGSSIGDLGRCGAGLVGAATG